MITFFNEFNIIQLISYNSNKKRNMFVAYVLMSLSYAYVMVIGVIGLIKETNSVECLDEFVTGE